MGPCGRRPYTAAGGRFPSAKYGLLRRQLLDDRVSGSDSLISSPGATAEEIAVAHCPENVRSFRNGSISTGGMRRIGLPWSPETWRRASSIAGGAIARGIPVSIGMGCGYADPIGAILETYANTWRTAQLLI